MEKKRIIKSYEKLTLAEQEEFDELYRPGFGDKIKRLQNAKGENFFVVPLESEEVVYLVKVELPKPKKVKEEEEDQFSNNEDEGDEKEDADDDNSGKDSSENSNDPSYEPNYDI